MAKRLSKAARAALLASGKDVPKKGAPLDVEARLSAIDPGFVQGPRNRFAETTADDAGALLPHIDDADPAVRADAVEMLGHLRHRPALSPIRDKLGDPDREVRTHAAVALIRIGDDVLFPEIVKALRHQDPRVVIGAAVALGRLADKRVVPNLVEAFKTENPEVGAAVAWALGQCQDPAALPWLTTALAQGFATANVCEALGRIGSPKAEPALREALTFAGDDTRAYAARALGLVYKAAVARDARAANALVERSQDKLRALLSDPSRKVRLCAAIALYEMGAPMSAQAMTDALAEEPAPPA